MFGFYPEGVRFHSPGSRSPPWGQSHDLVFTPKGFDSTAQGREAHPGDNRTFWFLPRRGSIPQPRVASLRAHPGKRRPTGDVKVTQGAPAKPGDPGLRNTTPSG